MRPGQEFFVGKFIRGREGWNQSEGVEAQIASRRSGARTAGDVRGNVGGCGEKAGGARS